ncbi:hypothetical protein [Gordonia alkanivorans]|uniref:hypothetical protein n=1 Tax=Gordonia alkanivorans TaxID=84096 RepID=UPI0012DC7118|nr:hypothetical protein [Gordonia alkanivorans]
MRTPAILRGEWSLFADWCGAFERQSLPASPVTVAMFLATENPNASRDVLRRRVSAINRVHYDHGYSAPGTATAVRRLLSLRDRHANIAHERIRELPTTGWPAGLFGRRDALVLWLVCRVGIAGNAVGELRCGDLTMPRTGVIAIGGGHDIEIAADPDDPFGLLPVWKRWAKIRDILATRPGPTPLVKPLTAAKPVDPRSKPALDPPPMPNQPGYALLPAFDRWGNLQSLPGHDDEGISGVAAASIVQTHVHGIGRGVTTRDAWVKRIIDRDAEHRTQFVTPPPVEVAPLPDRHAEATAARHRAREVFDGIDDAFDDIDRRTADLLARTEALLANIGE